MADRVIDLIYLKYLKAAVSYHKETRVEKYPFARDAVREAVYNALIHCNWAGNAFIKALQSGYCESLLSCRLYVGINVGLEKKILTNMEEDSFVTMGAISDKLNVTKRTVERIVKKLRENALEASVMAIG